MIFDSDWLTEYLNDAPNLDTLAKRLTDSGCLVELREKGDGAEKWDVEVTTNRPDAMNHRGLAREAAVAVGGQLLPLDFELSECDEDATELATVEIADPALCPRYVARVIRGVTVGPSPGWMQSRLLNCGVRPINAVVDATNYVLLELGQPLHAFDLDLVRGRQIVVRPAQAGEKLTTLDGEERKLDPSVLVIADGEGVVALAGIMGGADSEIGNDTTDVLIESAHFDALSVRRTSRRTARRTTRRVTRRHARLYSLPRGHTTVVVSGTTYYVVDEVKYTYDERIEDGLYGGIGMQIVRDCLEHPEKLL